MSQGLVVRAAAAIASISALAGLTACASAGPAAAVHGSSPAATPVSRVRSQPCLQLLATTASRSVVMATPRAALLAATQGRPRSMFRSGGLAQPPAGNWVADVKDATHWHVRFNHVTLGRVDWSAYVAYSEEWDIGSKPLNGWTYAGGGPAPFPALDSINFCPELVRH